MTRKKVGTSGSGSLVSSFSMALIPSSLGMFGDTEAAPRPTFTLPAAKGFAGVLDDVVLEVKAAKGSKQAARRGAPMPIGKYR